MYNKFNSTLVTIICAGFITTGCASTTAASHAKRNAHISMKDLLGEPPTVEERQILAQESNVFAEQALDAQEFKLALRHAYNAVQNDPVNIQARKLHAESLLQLGNYTESERGFKTLLMMASDGVIYQGYGLSILKQDRYEEGRAALMKATEINPTLWRAWEGVGLSYAAEENWALADEAYQRALAINSNQPEIHNNIGLALMSQYKVTEAQAVFAKAKTLPRGDAISDSNYRLALALNGYPDQAFMGLGDMQRAQLYNTLGLAALRRDDKNAAIDYFKKAISHHPSHYTDAAENLEIALVTH